MPLMHSSLKLMPAASMKYLTLLIVPLFALLAASPAHASSQILLTQTGNLSTSVSNFGIVGVGGTPATVENTTYGSMPGAGTVTTLYVTLSVAPGVGNTRTITIHKNLATTTQTCAIVDTAISCNDTLHPISYVEGDQITYEADLTGTPAVSTLQLGSTNVTSGNGIYFNSRTTTKSNSITEYTPVTAANPSFANFATEGSTTIAVGSGGTFSNIHYSSNVSAGGGTKTQTVTLRKNYADTSLLCATNGLSCSDLTDSASVVSGDQVNFSVTPANTPTGNLNIGFGVKFVPTDKSITTAFMGAGMTTQDSATVANYLGIASVYNSISNSEIIHQSIIPDYFHVTGLYASTTDPAGGTTRVFTIRKNGVNTSMTCTVNSGSSTCTAGGDVAFNPGDLISLQDLPTGTAVRGYPTTWITGYVAHGFVTVPNKLNITSGSLTIN